MKIDTEQYYAEPPPEPSPRLALWVHRLQHGWRPNRRVRRMGYNDRAEFFGVYVWEYFNVLYPLLQAIEE